MAGTTTLLLGRGAAELRETITAFGGFAVMAAGNVSGDPRGAGTEAWAVRIGAAARLPFADAVFDSVFAPYLTQRELRGASDGELARECARVLKPGGRLIVSIANPRLAATLRWGSVLARSAAGRLLPSGLSRRLLSYDLSRSPLPYAVRRLRRLFARAGYESVTVYSLWPRLGAWDALVPWPHTPPPLPVHRRRSRAFHLLIRTAAYADVTPGRLAVATLAGVRSAVTAAGPSVLESIGAGQDHTHDAAAPPEIVARGTQLAHFVLADEFWKIALTPAAAHRQRAETAANVRLRGTPAAGVMVDFVRRGEIGDLSYAVYPHVEACGYGSEAARIEAQAEAFRMLETGAATTPLRTTETWRRIFSGESLEGLTALGAGGVCARLEAEAGSRSVPAGIVHGDLHLHNVMRRGGRMVFIDWDRSECRSPLLIDRCYGVYWLLARPLHPVHGDRWNLLALRMMARRDAGIPLLGHIDATTGELDWSQTISLHVLSMISWRLIQSGAALDSAAQRHLREQVALCAEILG